MQHSIVVASALLLAWSHSTGITIIRNERNDAMQTEVTSQGEIITVDHADPEKQARIFSSLLVEEQGKHEEDHEHQKQTDANSSQVDDALSEEDPETGVKKINHHYILHESQKGKPVDGILYLKDEKPFTTAQFEEMCHKLEADMECLEDGVPMVVVRASKEHLNKALTRVPEVQFAPFKQILPKVVSYVKKRFNLKDAKALGNEYSKVGVKFPRALKRIKLDNSSEIDDVISERDPKTGIKKINHHYILHESQKGKPIDGILYLEDEKPFTTAQFEEMCHKLEADMECLEDGVPMAVVRASKKHLETALRRVPEVKFAPFKRILPKVLSYIKKKFRSKDVKTFINEYRDHDVKFDVKMMMKGIKQKYVKLDDPSPIDDVVSEKDPETSVKKINHHYILHESQKGKPIDGILYLEDEKPFTTAQFEEMCGKLAADVECLQEGVPMAVVRASKEHLNKALSQAPEVKFAPIRKILPKVVSYIKKKFRSNDTKPFIKEYRKTGVTFPVEMIKGEIKREHVTLDDPSPIDEKVSEKDPETGVKKINHHYMLHESQKGKPVDGILYLDDEQKFTTAQFEEMCHKLEADMECLEDGVPMVVVRSSKEHLDKALSRTPAVKFAPFARILPKVVSYIKKKFGLKDAHTFIKEYKNHSVTFPVKMIVQEFKREQKKFDNP